jgi:hypothetical protein
MNHSAVLLAVTMIAVGFAGCSSSAPEEPAPTQPVVASPTPKPSTPAPPPEPFVDVEVYNKTLQYDVQPVAADSFAAPEGASKLKGSLKVVAREVCSSLQPNADQKGPKVEFVSPSNVTQSVDLTPRAALCATNGAEIETKPLEWSSEKGTWSVRLVGVGNVNVQIQLTAMA